MNLERRLAQLEASIASRSADGLSADDKAIRTGDLRFLLHKGQLEGLATFEAAPGSRFVFEVARRWGKTWLMLVIAFMTCLKKPRSRVVYGAPTLKLLAEFVLPTLDALTEKFPRHLAPKWNAQTSHVVFPNGSFIHLFGADDKHKADRGRGPSAELAIFDEAGFCPLLRYVLRSVFRPSLLHSGGRTIVASTPAELPDHDFTEIAELAEANGAYFNRDVWSNPLLTKEQVEKFIADDARDEGVSVEAYVESDTFKREYLAQRVVNRLLVAVPEWAEMREKRLVKVARPKLFRGHTVLDFGGNDPHAAIFGYWHPELGFVVERDLLMKYDERSKLFSEAIKEREKEVWGTELWDGSLPALATEHLNEAFRGEVPDWLLPEVDRDAPPQPWLRINDIHPEIARHLYGVGLASAPVHKAGPGGTVGPKQFMVQEFRNIVRDGQFWLDPACVDTDRHLRTTTWANEKRKDWARRGGEHGDLLDCFVAGTMIRAERGEMPVEGLRPGDMVWTRKGLRRVIRANRTAAVARIWQLTATNGATLEGTADHPIWTQYGWRRLSDLTESCMLSEWSQSELSGAAESGSDSRTPSSATIASITCTADGEAKSTYTAPSGPLRMVRYLAACASIMWMEIRSTTRSRILPASPTPSTCASMDWRRRIASGWRRFASLVAPKPSPGIARQRAGRGHQKTANTHGAFERLTNFVASFVAALSSPRSPALSFAAPIVTPSGAATLASTTSTRSADSAAQPSGRTATPKESTAPVRVQSVRLTDRSEPVYNLQVEGEPEYFANGILVHNCCVYFVRGGSRDVPMPAKPRVFDEDEPSSPLERRLAGRMH